MDPINALVERVARVTEEMDLAMRDAIAIPPKRPTTQQIAGWLSSLRIGLNDAAKAG